MTSLKTSIKTITYLSDIGCLEIQGASLCCWPVGCLWPPLMIISPECKISGTVTSAEPNETDNQEKYVVRYLCPIKLMLGQKLCGIFNRVERGTSRHAKKPAIIDTVDPERDKGS